MLIISHSAQNWAANLTQVRSRIDQAAAAAGRDPATITLIAVSKTHTADAIRGMHSLGVSDFGESYLQEALPKQTALSDAGIRWHYIGQLQTNKTRGVAEHFDWVHSVDRLQIAQRLSNQRPSQATPLNVCLQVKLVTEDTKGGVEPAELPALADAVAGLERLRLRGLMCIPPATDNIQAQRQRFRHLRELLADLNTRGHALDTLSMGMSDDFEAAIAEGATHLRIGTLLFGERQ